MSEEKSEPTIDVLADGTPVRSEEIGFSSAELLPCGACRRMNPPDRIKCLYCGVELEVKPEHAGLIKTDFRKLDEWENGFNVIIRPGEMPNGCDISDISSVTGLNVSEVSGLLSAGGPIPLGRYETQSDAGLVAAELGKIGMPAVVIADSELAPDNPPTRLRSLEFDENEIAFVNFNNSERTASPLDDMILLVSGVISKSKTEQIEKRKLRGPSTVVDETETSSDEAVLDIYIRSENHGFRVFLTGFDFSCLGTGKELLAVRNMNQLISRLNGLAPGAVLVANYGDVRHALTAVWDVDRRKDSQGLQRSGFGKFDLGISASASNLRQFNKFSRMHRCLL